MDTSSENAGKRIEGGAFARGMRFARRSVRVVGRWLSDLFLPPVCVHCGRDRWRASPLCLACHRVIRPSQGISPALPSDALDARCLFTMSAPLSTLIHGFKYHHRLRHVRALCTQLRHQSGLRAWAAGFDAMVPVPIHSVRRRERGYNQAEAIARGFAEHTGSRVLAKALRRGRPTRSQTKLNRDDRRANLAGAFTCPQAESVRGKRILIVDDVFTTGATAEACARALRAAGAVEVALLALARVEAATGAGDFALEMEAISGFAA